MNRPSRVAYRAAARAAAWTERDERGRPVGLVVHSRLAGIGADWPLFRVLDAIDTARSVRWDRDPLLGHDLLVVLPDGTSVRFDVRQPAALCDCGAPGVHVCVGATHPTTGARS